MWFQGLSVTHIAVTAIIFMVLFGTGRAKDLIGDLGKGLGIFKKTLNEGTDLKQSVENEVRQIKHDLDRKV